MFDPANLMLAIRFTAARIYLPAVPVTASGATVS
jgi:hypothetical protein